MMIQTRKYIIEKVLDDGVPCIVMARIMNIESYTVRKVVNVYLREDHIYNPKKELVETKHRDFDAYDKALKSETTEHLTRQVPKHIKDECLLRPKEY